MSNINYGIFTIKYKSDILQQFGSVFSFSFFNNISPLEQSKNEHKLIQDIIIQFDDDYFPTNLGDLINNSALLLPKKENKFDNYIANELNDLNDTITCFTVNNNCNPFIPYNFNYKGLYYDVIYNCFLTDKIKLLFSTFDSNTFDTSIYNCVFSKSNDKETLVFGITKLKYKLSFELKSLSINPNSTYLFAYDDSIFSKTAVLNLFKNIFKKN